jgi:hypothetical protein
LDELSIECLAVPTFHVGDERIDQARLSSNGGVPVEPQVFAAELAFGPGFDHRVAVGVPDVQRINLLVLGAGALFELAVDAM